MIGNPKNHGRKTKIIATVGPACMSFEKLLELAKAGVNVFRLNMSHGIHEEKAQVIQWIRKINEQENRNISILGDLQGPKLRVGDIENNSLMVKENDIITFTTNEVCVGNMQKIYVSYPNLAHDVKVGNKILINDGKIVVEVSEICNNGNVKAKVIAGGEISSKKGINLPDTQTSLPALTEKDMKDLHFLIKEKVDWVALSFVRRPEDILNLRRHLNEANSTMKIIAKIEKPEAIPSIDEIISATDAVMVARGDLGIEIPYEKVPFVQKEIIEKCLILATPVIVATQMLESLIDKIQPNRSEISDIANAVLDGADAVMLSGETASGEHPVLAVEVMAKIVKEAESSPWDLGHLNDKEALKKFKPQELHSDKEGNYLSRQLCATANDISRELNIDVIAAISRSGRTASLLSCHRPHSPIFVFVKEKYLLTQLNLLWGVKAFLYTAEEEGFDNRVHAVITILKQQQLIKSGNTIIFIASTPTSTEQPTNVLKITNVL